MDLGIKIGTEFLDLPPGATLDLEQENPFLQFNDDLIGSFSLPFEVLATPKNLRLLNYAGVMEKRVDNTGIDAIAYEGGIQHSRGKIKIEKPTINLNKTREGSISCYYLTGASSFWQDVKNKSMRDIDLGGSVTMEANAWGLMQYDVMQAAPNTYPYAIFPVVNHLFFPEIEAIKCMNEIFDHDGTSFLFGNTSIVPFPYLHYALKQAVKFAGWEIKGGILDDEDFRKIVMINFRSVNYGYINPGTFNVHTFTNVTYDLAEHMPGISISEFLIALKNRFGWWYDFDRATKIITIRHLKDIVGQSAIDYTKHSSPVIQKTINQNTRIYALKNNFATNLGDGQPNFKAVTLDGYVQSVDDLPAVSDALYGHAYIVIPENNFYVCQLKEDSDELEWKFYTYNIYDVVPDGSNEEITTGATLVGNDFYNEILDSVPRIDNEGEWEGLLNEETSWGIHLTFHHGMQPNKAGRLVPFASPHVYNMQSEQIGNWSLSFEGQLLDGTKIGLYDREWKAFLELLKSNEKIESVLNLPMADYMNLSFSSQLVIRNTRMFLQKIKPIVPYSGSLAVECMRITT